MSIPESTENGDDSGNRDAEVENAWFEYRVEATVPHETTANDDHAFTDVKSDWLHRKSTALNLHDELKEAGFNAEIRIRKIGAFGGRNLESLPDRGAASWS